MSKGKAVKTATSRNAPENGARMWGYPALIYAFVAVWIGFVAYRYLKVYPVRLAYLSAFFSFPPGDGFGPADLAFPFRYLKEIGLAALLFLSAYGWGSLVNRLAKYDREQTLETGIVRIGVGFVLLACVLLAIGSLHLLFGGAVAAILLAGVISGSWELYLNRSRLRVRGPSAPFLGKALLLLTLAGVFFAFIGALSPETFYDSLMYHLALPKYWIQRHAVFAIPDFEYSYYPVNLHLIYLATLMFGNEIAAKLVHFLFGVLIALLIYTWSKRRFSAQAGLLAAGVFLLTPLVLMVMMKTAIELGLTFFETLAVVCFLNFTEHKEGEGTRWLVLSAVFSGMAMGSKYLSGYCFIVLFVLLAAYLVATRASWAGSIRKIALFAAIALVFPSPYLIRNFIRTGQPAYPYGFSLSTDFTATTKGKSVEFYDPPMPPRTVGNFFTLPWSVTMGTKTQEPYSGGLLLLLLPLPFLFRGADRKIKFLSGYVFLYYALWFFVRPYFRYGIPFVPPAAILFAYFVASPGMHRRARNFVTAAVILVGLSNLLLTVQVELTTMNPWGVVKGVQSRGEYLSTARPSYPNAYYPVAEWANRNLPHDAKILLLGEYRGFYLERKFETQTVVDHTSLVTLSKEARNADDLYAALRNNGITHILLSVPEARRLVTYDTIDFEPDQMKVFSEFWNAHIKEVHRDISDLALPERGIYSMRKQQPEWWQGFASDPRSYVYLYEIVPKDAASKARVTPPNPFLDPALYPPARWERLKTVMVSR